LWYISDWSCDREAPDFSNLSVNRHDVDEKSTVDIDDSVGKGLRRFLRHIVADAARDDAVRIFPGIGTGVRVWCAIGIAFQSNSQYGDVRTYSKPLFLVVIFSGPKDVFVPSFIVGWSAGFAILLCASLQAFMQNVSMVKFLQSMSSARQCQVHLVV